MVARVRVLLAAAAASGCFADAPPLDESTSGGEVECPAGARGCACNGNGTCDEALECAALVDLCVPAGCNPGAKGCVCAGIECLAGLACTGGVCLEPSTSSTLDDGAHDGSDGAASTTTTTDPLDDDDDSTSTAATTQDVGTSGASGCADGGCDACQACIDEHLATGACTPPSTACTRGCQQLRACMDDGGGTGACCAEHPDGVDAWHTLMCCSLIACPMCREASCVANSC